ncbi:MAG: zf-HC2 domain-containing protein [Candidatus Tectomicrobia bacterium]|uniref:Zf-HC2 domain-containing protein n=1 Tax=Tectimicrobiota bacterium TaxID=2528274 RepID=A0A932M0C4_UNCTE|nr:zf-HC2 domain-containing protein [Candidatus Tectomicrobia bacterium]
MFNLLKKVRDTLGCWFSAARGVSCEELVRLLIGYVDGTLPAEDRTRLDAHFKDCAHCLSMMRTYRQTIDLSRGVSNNSMPSEVRLRLQRFLKEKIQER